MARSSSSFLGIFPTAPSTKHHIPSFKVSFVPGQEALCLESCPIPSPQAVSCNHSTSSWDPASSTKPSPAESKVILLQLPTCSEPLHAPSLLLPLFVLNSRGLSDILSTKWLQCSACPFLCPSASVTAEARFINVLCSDQQCETLWSDGWCSPEITLHSITRIKVLWLGKPGSRLGSSVLPVRLISTFLGLAQVSLGQSNTGFSWQALKIKLMIVNLVEWKNGFFFKCLKISLTTESKY